MSSENLTTRTLVSMLKANTSHLGALLELKEQATAEEEHTWIKQEARLVWKQTLRNASQALGITIDTNEAQAGRKGKGKGKGKKGAAAAAEGVDNDEGGDGLEQAVIGADGEGKMATKRANKTGDGRNGTASKKQKRSDERSVDDQTADEDEFEDKDKRKQVRFYNVYGDPIDCKTEHQKTSEDEKTMPVVKMVNEKATVCGWTGWSRQKDALEVFIDIMVEKKVPGDKEEAAAAKAEMAAAKLEAKKKFSKLAADDDMKIMCEKLATRVSEINKQMAEFIISHFTNEDLSGTLSAAKILDKFDELANELVASKDEIKAKSKWIVKALRNRNVIERLRNAAGIIAPKSSPARKPKIAELDDQVEALVESTQRPSYEEPDQEKDEEPRPTARSPSKKKHPVVQADESTMVDYAEE